MPILPSISQNGWIVDNRKVLNHLFTYYLLSDYAQSYIFQNEIISLSHTYRLNINNPEGMASAVRSDLEKLLSRYFEQIEVETLAKKVTESQYAILIYAVVMTQEEGRIELSQVMEINTSNLRKVIQMNNYGDGVSYLNQL